MITVRCPACGKVIGFDEADGGALVACPHCREPFFVPAVARPVAPVETAPPPPAPPPPAPPLPQEPALPDEIGVAADPELDPILEQFDEVKPVDPPAETPDSFEIVPDEPTPPPQTAVIPRLELDEPPPPPPPAEPAEVKPTDLAPSRQAAEVLAEAVPEPIDVLEEVEEEDQSDPRPRPKPKKRKKDHETPVWAQTPRTQGWPRRRIMGVVAIGLGFFMLMASLTLQLTDRHETWPGFMCVSFDVLALVLMLAGLLYAVLGSN